jgi:outer membrane receptor protein involved in Fe transport
MIRYLIPFVFFAFVTLTYAATAYSNSDSLSIGLNRDTIIIHKNPVSSQRDTLRSYKDSTGVWVRDSLGVWKRDTISIADSITMRKRLTVRDTVIPIFQTPISNESYILSSDELRKNDYRYTPDYFKLFEFAYLGETGNAGAPDELYLYGNGTANINYLQNGIPLNSIPYILFDLNYVQSETVDSIEIVPSPRGFLYGSYNKPVSVNFISKDFISKTPFTRIKYYQGAFGEALFDGIFNSNIYKKLPVFFDVTNRKLDQRYTNSDFSSWQVTTQVKYLLSDSINFIGNYSYNKIYKALNGGVNVDTILSQGLDLNTYLYDEISAPVNHYNTDMDVTQHNFSLRMLAKPLKGAITDLSIYYKFNSQSLNNIGDDINNYEKTKNKSEGFIFNQKYGDGPFDLDLIVNYEHSTTDFILPPSILETSYGEFYNENLFSLAGSADWNLTDKLRGSVFYKYSYMNYELLHFENFSPASKGGGVDFNLKTTDDLSFYLGYSLFQDYFTNNYQGNAEISGTVSTSDLFVKLSAFTKNMQVFNNQQLLNTGYRGAILLLADIPAIYQYQNNSNVSGLALNLKYKFWILSFENNSSYYTGDHMGEFNKQNGLPGIPKFYSKSGIFISDSLFSNNLNLKGGFALTYYGKINYYYVNSPLPETKPAYILDFTLAGRIRKTATVYFTWENLLGFQYFLIPYYPNLGRNLRFGVAWDLFN